VSVAHTTRVWIVAFACLALAACDLRDKTSKLDGTEAPEPLLPTVRRARRALREWGLDPVEGELLFVAERIDDPPSYRDAECVPLADGSVLVEANQIDGYRPTENCFLRMRPTESGWSVEEVGIRHLSGCGFGNAWGEDLAGTITLDVRGPRAIACLVQVVGNNAAGQSFYVDATGEPTYLVNTDFWIDPQRDSPSLRRYLAGVTGGPVLR
jgi:hypothetical protein